MARFGQIGESSLMNSVSCNRAGTRGRGGAAGVCVSLGNEANSGNVSLSLVCLHRHTTTTHTRVGVAGKRSWKEIVVATLTSGLTDFDRTTVYSIIPGVFFYHSRTTICTCRLHVFHARTSLQGYLAHKKQCPLRAQQ